MFDDDGRLLNGDEAVGELVNTSGAGQFTGYYNDEDANQERMRGGMYWSGDLAYRDADGFVYFAGRTSEWLRVDGENLAAAPIERVLLRHPDVSRAAVYAVPDESAGDQVAAALVLHDGTSVRRGTTFEAFLAAQRDLGPKMWPRHVRVSRRAADDRHEQGPEARAQRPGHRRARRPALGAGRTRHVVPAPLVRLRQRSGSRRSRAAS